jgi:hypothetical protein
MQNLAMNRWTKAYAPAKYCRYMPKMLPRRRVVLCLAAALITHAALAQVEPLGTEYGISGPLAGDQVFPAAAINPSGGYVVYQDSFTDGNGFGISARRLDSTLSPVVFAPFRVNQQTVGNQQNPQVAILPDGAAAFVWQGGSTRHDQVWFRALNADGTFANASDIRVNVKTNSPQTKPVIAALPNGNYAVAWESMHEDGDFKGIFLRIVGPTGQMVTAPANVNQFNLNNQRTPAIAPLAGGGFVVLWASESEGLGPALDDVLRVHIYARVYDNSGTPVSDEFRINTGNVVCANPSVTALAGGGFLAAWSQRAARPDSWDVYARSFNANRAPVTLPFRLNSYTYGDQFAPRVASAGDVQLAVWTSLGQDGNAKGVIGRFLTGGAPQGEDFTNSTTIASDQMHPIVVSDSVDRILAVWTSYQAPVGSGFNLYGQRFGATEQIPQPGAPFVAALSSSRLSLTWTPLSGFPIAGYEIYMDGVQPPDPPTAVVTTNVWTQTGLVAGSTHSFRLAYVMEGGARSALSEAATGTTWGEDENLDGLPDDWQSLYWNAGFPAPNVDSDGDGASNASEFLAGTDPTNADSVLKTWITRSLQGPRLNWSTQSGFIYQIQTSADFGSSWSNLGPARFAPGASDSILLGNLGQRGFYRITRVR